MKAKLGLIIALVMFVTSLAACGGGGGAANPPVEMQKYEADTFVIEFPSAWKKSSIDMMGLTMAFFSTREFTMEDLGGLDMANLMSKDPMVVLMLVPSSLAGTMGLEDLDEAMESTTIGEDDMEIIKQGDTTLGGAKGEILIAKGTDPDVGKMGAHVVMAKKDDGTAVILMGVTPEQDMDKNLKVFQYMHDTFKFK